LQSLIIQETDNFGIKVSVKKWNEMSGTPSRTGNAVGLDISNISTQDKELWTTYVKDSTPVKTTKHIFMQQLRASNHHDSLKSSMTQYLQDRKRVK